MYHKPLLIEIFLNYDSFLINTCLRIFIYLFSNTIFDYNNHYLLALNTIYVFNDFILYFKCLNSSNKLRFY